MITIDGNKYTEEDLTPEQISEVNYMISLQNEVDTLSRRIQDLQFVLRCRQQAFLEQFKGDSQEAKETSEQEDK